MEGALERTAGEEGLDLLRAQVRRFATSELAPNVERFESERQIGREFWRKAGEIGLLAPGVPEAFGGAGLDYSYNAVITEELGYAGFATGFSVHNDIVADYVLALGTQEHKARYLPAMVSGEMIGAIAMSEPGTGSDLQAIRTRAIRDGDHYVLNGSKTYITNGQLCDFVVVAAKTDPSLGAKGISLFVVDAETQGFERGRKLEKVGLHYNDTSELFFNDMRLPAGALLGEEGRGFVHLMQNLPQERLALAIAAQAAAQRAFDEGLAFARERKAFGQPIADFQNSRFVLAELKTELQVGWAHIDWALARHVAGALTSTEASAAKLWHTELQGRAVDAALQLHGGAGYMEEYAIARLWRDARVTRIFGGSNEIMKELVGRSL